MTRPLPDHPTRSDVKRLADVLALVLDEQPGVSSAALQKVRDNARRDGFTGGALKNLLHQCLDPVAAPWAHPMERESSPADASLNTQLARQVTALLVELNTARGDISCLQDNLATAHQKQLALQAAVDTRKAKHFRDLFISTLCGAIAMGAAVIFLN